MAEEVDFEAVAEMTDGMVGAQLANILDVAALQVLRDRRTEVPYILNTSYIYSYISVHTITLHLSIY